MSISAVPLTDDELEINILAREFLTGELSSGEILLQLSGIESSCQSVATVSCLKVIECIISEIYDGKQCEVAVGILANLLLFNTTHKIVAETLTDIPTLLLLCSTHSTDPYVYSECFRCFSNLIYNDCGALSASHIEMLTGFMIHVFENSLAPKLVTQIAQCMYYCLSSTTQQFIAEVHKYWDVSAFFLKTSGDVEVLTLLSSQSLCSCSGLQWFLMCIEKLTLSSLNESDTGISVANPWFDSLVGDLHFIDTMAAQLLSLLSGGDLLAPRDWSDKEQSNAYKEVSLSNVDRFLVVSAVENLLAMYRTFLSTVPEQPTTGVLSVLSLYSHNHSRKLQCLCVALMELWEEALLLRDVMTTESVAYVLLFILRNQMIATENKKDRSGHNSSDSISNSTVCINISNNSDSCAFVPSLLKHRPYHSKFKSLLGLLREECTVQWVRAEQKKYTADSEIFHCTVTCLRFIGAELGSSSGNSTRDEDGGSGTDKSGAEEVKCGSERAANDHNSTGSDYSREFEQLRRDVDSACSQFVA